MADPAGSTDALIDPRAAAYLEALERAGVPVVDVPTLLLAADSVCIRRGDTDVSTQGDRLMAAFPGRWEPRQATIIVDCAIKLVCGQ